MSEDDASAELDMMSCESRDPSLGFESAIVHPHLSVHAGESLSDESVPVSVLGSALCSPRDDTRGDRDHANQTHSHWMVGEGEGEVSPEADEEGDFTAIYSRGGSFVSATNPALSVTHSPSSLLPTRAVQTSSSLTAAATQGHGVVDTAVRSPLRLSTRRGVGVDGMMEIETEVDTGTDSGSMSSSGTPTRLSGVVLLEEESV